MGWQEDQDALEAARASDGGRTPAPWHWEVHDSSMASLCGGGLDATIGSIMAVGPCTPCYEGKDDWEWGRCQTPSKADAVLIAAAPDLLAEARKALSEMRRARDRLSELGEIAAPQNINELIKSLKAVIAKVDGDAQREKAP
jgi:hypothetical protein